MNIPMSKYRFYTSKNMVIAVSTYAGKPVRGVAKCDPEDNFSFEDGKALAMARCNEKIAEKRMKRASRKFAEARQSLIVAKQFYEDMSKYLDDAIASYDEAKHNVNSVRSKLD